MTDSAVNRAIAIVDDDDLFRESLTGNLENEGFAVTCYTRGGEILAAYEAGIATDLILLDWKMPEMNGIEVLRQLRARSIATPVIFLTVLSDQIYEEAALLGGAIDFVEKSRSFAILRKRIDLALVGAHGTGAVQAPRGLIDVGPLQLDTAGKLAQWKGKPVTLTVGEFDIVEALASRAGDNVSYRDIYDVVRGQGFAAGFGEDGYRQNVRTFIKRIRGKFRDLDPDFEAIENYPGFGYRWQGKGDAG